MDRGNVLDRPGADTEQRILIAGKPTLVAKDNYASGPLMDYGEILSTAF